MSKPQFTHNRHAYLLALAAVLCWSTAASGFKISLRYVSPRQLVTIAALVSTALMAEVGRGGQ